MRSELFIDGQWVRPRRGGTFDVIDPATEQVIHAAPEATAEDVDLAVQAARRRFDDGSWSGLPGAERARTLRAIAAGIRGRLGDLARLEVLDNGKPLPEAEWDVGDAAGCFEYCAVLAEALDGRREETVALPDARFVSKAVKEPVGVAAAIIPWNDPLLMAAWKVAPALAAGCTMVLKPSEPDPAHRARTRGGRRRGRSARRRAEHRDRLRGGGRAGPGRTPAGGQDRLHRLGPVVCVRPFATEAEAVHLANDSRFGLAAAVMTADDARAERVAAALRAGIVWINCSQPTFAEAPWGGYKQFGIGRELGRWGLENYLEVKQVTRFTSDEPWGWYLKAEATP